MFNFAEETKNMAAVEILNYYRNLYYTEPQVTERGIVANAINDLLPNVSPMRHGQWRTYKQNVECSVCLVKWAVDESVVLVHTATKDLKYCPNCGAKMDGDANA